MLFFGKKDSGPDKPKTRSTLGMLLSPGIGTSIRPLGEAAGMFVQIIAMIFAANGLFPRNHPALLGGKVKLSMQEVIGTAWQGLSFTPEGLPRVVLFFAVVGCLVFSALALITIILTMFLGKAHAASVTLGTGSCSGGMFDPCDATQDLAQMWINFLFFPGVTQSYTPTFSTDTTTTANPITLPTEFSTALVTGSPGQPSVLAFYSGAILVCAAVILIYHLVVMVAETAHSGTPMGKEANQIWAPIRLVFAIGLLLPISGGLNTGQYIAIQIAEWGSGLASQTWALFIKNLNSSAQFVTPIAPETAKVAKDIMLMEACKTAYNIYLDQQVTGANVLTGASGVANANKNQIKTFAHTDTAANAIEYRYSLTDLNGAEVAGKIGICGKYTLTTISGLGTTTDPATKIANVHTTAFVASLANTASASGGTGGTTSGPFADVGKDVVNFIHVCYSNGGPQVDPLQTDCKDKSGSVPSSSAIPSNSDYLTAISNYQTALGSNLAGLKLSDPADIAGKWTGQGWIAAGAWFSSVAGMQGTISTAVQNDLPDTVAPTIERLCTDAKLCQEVGNPVGAFQSWLAKGGGATPDANGQFVDTINQIRKNLSSQEDVQKTSMLDQVFGAIDYIAGRNGVWVTPFTTAEAKNLTLGGNQLTIDNTKPFSLGVQLTEANPLAEISEFGWKNLNVAYEFFNLYMGIENESGALTTLGTASSAGSPFVGDILGTAMGAGGKLSDSGKEALSNAGGIFSTITLMFLATGFLVAFLLPLIPFMNFFFGALTWVVSVCESVICMPLVALAHLNPKGAGLPGDQAKTAYFFLFNIFLRPVLMIFGLIVAFLIFFIAVMFMNQMYLLTVVSVGGASHGHLTLARLIYSAMYVVLLYFCANNAFKLIGFFPEHAMKWFGGQGLHAHVMGAPEQMTQTLTLASSYIEQKLLAGAGQASKMSGMLSPTTALPSEKGGSSLIKELRQGGHDSNPQIKQDAAASRDRLQAPVPGQSHDHPRPPDPQQQQQQQQQQPRNPLQPTPPRIR